MNGSSGCAIIVFARRPVAGRVKTRLAEAIGAHDARRVYEQLLDRALDNAASHHDASNYLYVARSDDRDYFERRLDSHWVVSAQQGRDLGMRMHRALRDVLQTHARAILIGSDIADASPSDIAEADRLLNDEHADVVFGPVADGGYWLVGLKCAAIQLFQDIPWSSSLVLKVSHRRCADLGLTVAELDPRHDIDNARDLEHFRDRLR